PILITATLTVFLGVTPAATAESPRGETFRTTLKKEMSNLNVSIEASSDELSKTLNQTLRKELYKGSTKTRGLTADIVRNGPIAVSAADNYLYFTLPVTMSLSYGMFETPAIPLKLKFRANPRITPDWKLKTEIYYLGLSDLLAEDVGIGPLSIKPRSIMEGITQPLQQGLSETIGKKIQDKFPLKNQITKVWNAAQKPISANRKYNAWLKVTPREVMMSPLRTRNNRITLSVGIKSFAEMVVGPEPAAQPLVPLPNLKLVNTFDKSFRIALNTDLFYRDLLTIASPLLLDKEFTSDGKTIVIKDFDLYGNEDKFVIKIATKGSLDGVFYLTGKPHFDPQTNIFSVKDVDFDMETQSLLLRSADWFLHGTIKNRIQEKLNMDLTNRLEQTREMAQKAIAQVQLADHLLLKGTIKTLHFSDVLLHKDKISIQVCTEGESAIYFQ
ncbi:MAG: DUF4403 family protein, partial [Deltaproteobacteria bacterium]|nr:DUF4403 family protein [Deltaproteobacteria bacterium]